MTDRPAPEESLEDLYAEASRVAPPLAEAAPDDASVRAIAEGAARLAVLNANIDELEERAKVLRSERHVLSTQTLPALMDEAGTDRIGIPGALADLVVTTDYHANISVTWEPERREAAFAHLDELGGGSLIEATVAVAFQREDLPVARKLLEVVQVWLSAGRTVARSTLDMTVKWQTLKSFVREYEEAPTRPGDNRVPLDRERIGASVTRLAKIVPRKDADSRRRRSR